MGYNRGINGGLSGIVGMNIPDDPRPYVFAARVTVHEGEISHGLIDRTGRGCNKVKKYRLGDLSGGGSAEGHAQVTGPIFPTSMQNAIGTITHQLDTNYTVVVPVRMKEVSWKQAEKAEDGWRVSFEWILNGQPVITSANPQQTPDVPANNSQETYEGLSKVTDQNGITTSATQRIDVQTVDDTDTAENAQIAATVGAAVAPIAGLKLIDTTAIRTDAVGMVIMLKWGLQDSKDNIETPRNVYRQDNNALDDSKTLAAVFTTGSPPSDPTPPSGLKIVDFVDYKVNDTFSFRFWTMGREDSVDRIQNPQTRTITDPLDLESSGTRDKVFTTASPPADPSVPSGLVLRFKEDTQLNDLKSNRLYTYGKRTTKEDKEFPGTFTEVDPNAIDTAGKKTTIHDTASPPADPSPPSDTKIVKKTVYSYTSGTTAKSYTVWDFAVNDSADRITNAGSYSRRFANRPKEDVVSSLVSSTSDAITIANAYAPGFFSTPYGAEMTVRKVTPGVAELLQRFVAPGILLKTKGGQIGPRVVKAKIVSGNVQVFVTSNISRGSGKRMIVLSPQTVHDSVYRAFSITRMMSGVSIPEFTGLYGKANASSFLGISSGTVRYCSNECDFDFSLLDGSTVYNFDITWNFESDSLGFFDAIPDDCFHRPLTVTSSSTSTGWVNASSLGLVVTPATLSTGDYSVFVT